VKGIVNQAKTFINTIKEEINNSTALFNALLCGLINGIISLLQLVVLIIGYIIDNFAILELEKPFSREEFDKSGQRLEFVEDLIETLTERSEKIFNGLLLNLITANTQFIALVDSIYKKLKGVSRYFIAYFLGAIVFELVFDVILAFFTGGTSLAANISLAATKAVEAGIKAAKQVGKKIVLSTTDILRVLRAEFDELIQAIVNGKFLKYIEEKISDFLELGKKVAKNVIDDIKKFFRDFDPEDLDWMHRRHRVGSLGGKVLTTRQIRVLRKLLKEKYGVDLIFEGSSNIKSLFKPIGNFKNPKQLFEYMSSFHTPKVGVFDSKTAQMLLPKNTTEIIAFHELAHVKHWKSVGDDVYQTINTLDREMNVWEQVFKNRSRWTKEELEDALRYINDIRVSPRYGFEIEPLHIKI
jgi:hypothetical protein